MRLSNLLLILFFTLCNASAATLSSTIGNPVTRQDNIFRSNVNPTFNFATDANGGTVTSIVLQLNNSSNAGFGYPDSMVISTTVKIKSGSTIIDTFTYSSWDAANKRVTLSGSAALSGSTTYTIELGCTTCANTGFDQTTTNATGWQFTSDYYSTGYPVMSLSGTASPANAAPILGAIGDQTGNVGVAVNLTISATDADEDDLIYSATNLPAGLSINTSTGQITGTPTTQAVYSTTVTVSDGTASDSETFTWTVNPAPNNAPTLSNIYNQTSTFGQTVSLQVSASDDDLADTLSFSATGLPTGLSINSSTGLISGTPTSAGIYNPTVNVSDGKATQSISFTWTVNELPNPVEENQVVSEVNTISQFAPRNAIQTLKPVKTRLNVIKSGSSSFANISTNAISVRFAEISPEIQTLMNAAGIPNGIYSSGNPLNNGWAVWTEGSVIVGQNKNSTHLHIDNLAIGIDKKLDQNLAGGIAVRGSWEDSHLHHISKFSNNALSTTIYGSYAFNNKSFIQAVIGRANMEITTERLKNSNTIKGKRKASQYIYSLIGGYEILKNQWEITPYVTIDGSSSKLHPFAEYGSIDALNYLQQKIDSITASAGARAKFTKKIGKAKLIPELHINYQGDLKSQTETQVHYVILPDSLFSKSFDANASSTWLGGFGVDYIINFFNASAEYERSQQVNYGHTDTYRIMLKLSY